MWPWMCVCVCVCVCVCLCVCVPEQWLAYCLHWWQVYICFGLWKMDSNCVNIEPFGKQKWGRKRQWWNEGLQTKVVSTQLFTIFILHGSIQRETGSKDMPPSYPAQITALSQSIKQQNNFHEGFRTVMIFVTGWTGEGDNTQSSLYCNSTTQILDVCIPVD
jgi:hypothetical protein